MDSKYSLQNALNSQEFMRFIADGENGDSIVLEHEGVKCKVTITYTNSQYTEDYQVEIEVERLDG